MTTRFRQSGAALFAAIFLIVVLAGLGITVALITTTQQVSSGQALDATRAYYAARARLEQEIDIAIDGAGGCSGNGNETTQEFTTTFNCNAVAVQEGGTTYNVLTMSVTAYRGDRDAGTRVRRRLRVQLTDF
ncbi:MAG: hypothetical protein U5K33_07620 [Halofilum sp. (in: g-proteobacteria)]|nr:hypothetical protein [Halofilum sp. (in: g-proteobacteria)]